MDRIVYLKLAGVEYPLLFSMQALIEICEKYETLKNALDQMVADSTYETQFDIVTILSQAGSEFLKSKKQKADQIDRDQLRFGNPFELAAGKLSNIIIECINMGAHQTVETEESSKNAETAQE